jgi:hypothetical protein
VSVGPWLTIGLAGAPPSRPSLKRSPVRKFEMKTSSPRNAGPEAPAQPPKLTPPKKKGPASKPVANGVRV